MNKRKNENEGGLVYSTEHGRMCPGCSMPVLDCTCDKRKACSWGDGVVRVQRDTKGRNGKVVTVISGIPLDEKGIKQFAKDLKSRCGCGGTVKDSVIEIQGDNGDLIMTVLHKKGWPAKRTGG